MSRFDQSVAKLTTLSDYIKARERTIELLRSSYRALSLADDTFKTVYGYGLPYDAQHRERLETVIKQMDQRLWRQAYDVTGFGQLMDRQAREEFDRSLEKAPPAFTEDNVRSIFLSAAQQAEEMFARGVVNVFRGLSKLHRTNTNDTFKVNRRAIMAGIVKPRWGGGLEVAYGRARDELNDLDRVFRKTDGQQHHPRALETALNGALKDSEVYEDDYFQMKGFGNGNLHVLFKRKDLLDQINKIIHDYHDGSAVAKDRPGRAHG